MSGKALIVLGVLGAAGYYGWQFYQKSKSDNSDPFAQTPATNNIINSILSGTLNNVGNDVLNSPNTTRGFRNNNPTNIMWYSPINWQGQIGKDSGGYAIFDTVENGLRAAAINLNSYIKSGRNTIRQISDSWTATAKSTHANAVRQRTGIGLDNVVTKNDIPALIDGIIFAENSSVPYTKSQIASAVSMAKLT